MGEKKHRFISWPSFLGFFSFFLSSPLLEIVAAVVLA